MSEEGRKKIAPILIHSFASRRIRPGETWRVYLAAHSVQESMKSIVCTLEQPGVGINPVSITRIPEDQQKNLSGYVYLNTAGVQGLNFMSLVLTVQIQDKAGNYSHPISFPLNFDALSRQQSPPPGIFAERDLGPIMATLTVSGGGP